MRKEIILPPHLYDRIKASAGEHGGIGAGRYFADDGAQGPGTAGEPFCAHGHAWGTCSRFLDHLTFRANSFPEPELNGYLTVGDNDDAIRHLDLEKGERISFDRWCRLLNVKRGVASVVDCELAVD